MTSGQEIGQVPDYIGYADFGARFFESAVTEARLLEAVRSLAGRPIDFGPIGVGPGGLVKVSATGNVGEPGLTRVSAEHVTFVLQIPVDLQMLIDLGLEKSRFTAEVVVRLTVTARPADPLLVVIDIEPPTTRDVDVDLHAAGLRASVLQILGRVDDELRRFIVKYVRREITKPRVASARVIDVGATLAKIATPGGR